MSLQKIFIVYSLPLAIYNLSGVQDLESTGAMIQISRENIHVLKPHSQGGHSVVCQCSSVRIDCQRQLLFVDVVQLGYMDTRNSGSTYFHKDQRDYQGNGLSRQSRREQQHTKNIDKTTFTLSSPLFSPWFIQIPILQNSYIFPTFSRMHRKLGVAPRKCEIERLEWHPENEKKKIIVINTASTFKSNGCRGNNKYGTSQVLQEKTSIMHCCGFIKPTRFPCPLITENFLIPIYPMPHSCQETKLKNTNMCTCHGLRNFKYL